MTQRHKLFWTRVVLDSTTIDPYLSVFRWAYFRSTKAVVKMHTLLDLRGSILSFICISDGKLRDVDALDLLIPETGQSTLQIGATSTSPNFMS